MNWKTNCTPACDMRLVLLKLQNQKYPIWFGFYDGNRWRSNDGTRLKDKVNGWMEIDEAAYLLDEDANDQAH